MAKPSTSTKSAAIPKSTKKARIEEPSRPLASRVKGSPRPQKQKSGKSKNAENEAPASAPSTKSKGKQKDVSEQNGTPQAPKKFKIIAGSYEKLLYGLEGTTSLAKGSNEVQFDLKPMFIFPAHVSCIKAVAASPSGGKWLATGSADEIIKVWDLRRRKEIGGLMHHEGSITHLNFASRSHLISASEDGTLCLFHARDWSVLRALKGHKGRVNAVAVHPSGKVALSVGKDRTLRMWDLMRGKGCASTKLGKEGEIVRWSSDGSLFIVMSGTTIDVYNTSMTLLHTINHPSRLHDAKFTPRVDGNGEVLLVGAEDKTVSIYDISSDQEQLPKIIGKMVGHKNRIKAVQTLSISLPTTEAESRAKATTIVCTASSDGRIHVYDLADLPANSSELATIHPVATYDTKGTRLTCVTIADGDDVVTNPANGKRKREDNEEEGDEGSEGNEDADGWNDIGDGTDSDGASGEEGDKKENEGEEEEEEAEFEEENDE
ncbi:p21-activated protein kinase-interacting protein 1-like [Moniliophthora roreri]|uniref:Uncharacterized protein n=1 Tax=Moniliophthora roreri TaxID=221103 RepID=A0A0W0GEC7_MONRR|nr:p21-activated protein kinase-interacting protein 1-like [Moniliophthora roreri]